MDREEKTNTTEEIKMTGGHFNCWTAKKVQKNLDEIYKGKVNIESCKLPDSFGQNKWGFRVVDSIGNTFYGKSPKEAVSPWISIN